MQMSLKRGAVQTDLHTEIRYNLKTKILHLTFPTAIDINIEPTSAHNISPTPTADPRSQVGPRSTQAATHPRASGAQHYLTSDGHPSKCQPSQFA